MSNNINISINGTDIKAEPGQSVLQAARDNGIDIPSLCHDPRVKAYGGCGICLVEMENSPKLMRSCALLVSKGMKIYTNTDRVIKARTAALNLLLSDHVGDCRPPCSLACPAGTDCQDYVGLIANGEYKESIKLLKDRLPIPASIGRICPHPCETACRRQLVEDPISIAQLKSFVADIDLNNEEAFIPERKTETGKKIAIIGGGPGGLSAAYYLSIMGHAVTIFDMMPKMGGMLRYGIPEYRLPKAVLDKEIELIAKLGVEYKNNEKLGKGYSLDSLQKEYDAVVVAVGAWNSVNMRVKGENLDGVIGGIDFLRNVIEDKAVDMKNKKVAVCGGGNTAMDACRTAVRLGADKVYIVYRRTRDEMPAEKIEIDEAFEEGVEFKFLTNPEEILSDNGKVSGIKLQKMKLGEPDASGRRSPVAIDGDFEELALDYVIMAIGQKLNNEGLEQIELTKWGTISADEHSFRTNIEGIFAIGDATNKGADIAVSACGEAKRVSEVVDAYLQGADVSYKKPFLVEQTVTEESFRERERINREKMPHMNADERKNNFKEIVFGYSEEQAKKEASRCLECGCHDYFNCKLLKYSNEYDVHPERFGNEKPIKRNSSYGDFIERNNDKCILCGLCVRACAEMKDLSAIGLLGRGYETVVSTPYNLPLDKTPCNACGLCVQMCPTGALKERSFLEKQVPLAERFEKSECILCEKKCSIVLSYIGDSLIRVIPADACSGNCHLGREMLNKGVLEAMSK